MYVGFRTSKGGEILVNTALIRTITPNRDGTLCTIAFDEGHNLIVEGKLSRILSRINGINPEPAPEAAGIRHQAFVDDWD
ncbi:hypothetical protein [Sphingomonas sp. ID0503]|uniref:hypothetical protein n=1 Tax=Sphingomonas sp. ID0503 TaxID=3399691 RepID=UPI003AFAEE09